MRTIYKYPLHTIEEQIIEMPLSARMLCVQVQYGMAHLWVEVTIESPATPLRYRNQRIFVVGTSNPVPDNATQYIGSYQLHEGRFMGHVYTREDIT